MGRSSYLPDIAMVITCFFWGLNAVVTKNALGETPEAFQTFIFNGIRIPAASLLLFLSVKFSGKTAGIRVRDLPVISGVAFFGMFLFMMCFIVGMSLTTASNAGVINASTPLLILIVSMITGIERPSARTVLGIFIGFSGMLFLAYRKGQIAFNTGDALILGSCFGWAIYTVFGKRILQSYNPMAATAWIYLLTSIFQFPFFLWQLPKQPWSSISPGNWINISISCVGSLYLANTFYYYAIAKIGPSRVGAYTNLTPVFTLILASMLRDEHIVRGQVIGLAIIIVGILLTNYRRETSLLTLPEGASTGD